MNAKLRLAVTAAMVGTFVGPALADDRQTTQPSADQQQKTEAPAQTTPPLPTMKELLTAGYEIKATTFIPHDAVKRGGSSTDVDAVVFVLENGPAVAVCYTDFASYTSGGFYTLGCTEMK